MNQKMKQEAQISEASNETPACARAEELVSYLYQEASAAQAHDFEQHMRGCVSCRAELEEFGIVRESIGDWRTSALGGLFISNASEASLATSFEASKDAPARQRNALAALREFFTLSPGWMRAATAFAGLAFCALAVIAFTHFFERAETQTALSEKPPVVEKSSDKIYTKQQVDEMLARVKQESDAGKQQRLDQESHHTDVAVASPSSTNSATRQTTRKSATVPSPVLANASTVRRGTNHISTRDRQQLAEVLLPQETKDEEKLPRLSDLLQNDSN
jgi:anti-sigma factor RsiW